MAISSSGPGWVYTVASAGQTQFAVPFPFFLHTDLEVYDDGSLATAYAVSGGSGTTGTVTFYTPRAAGTQVFIRRVTARRQLQDYPPNDPFNAAATEAVLDKLTLMVQDLLEELGRRPALVVGIAEALRDLEFPSPVPLRLIGWNADGSALTLFDPAIVQVTVDPVSGEAHGKSVATLTASGGATSLTASALIPAGVKVKGVGYRCLTSFDTTFGLTSVDLGGMGIVEGWGSQLGITAGSVNNEGHMRGDEPRTLVAEDVTLLANGGTFGSAGSAKLTVFWRTLTPDT